MKNPFSLRQLKNTVAIKLTVWFLLLSLLPIAIIVLFVRSNINYQFIDLAAHDLSDQSRLLAVEISLLDNDTDIIKSLFAAYQSQGVESFVIDAKDNMILYANNENISNRIYGSLSANTTHQILTESEGLVVDTTGKWALAFNRIGQKELIIVSVRDLSSVYSLISSMEKKTFTQLLISLFVVAIASGLAILMLLSPIQELVGITNQVGSGNLNVRMNLPEYEGEIGTLAQGLNEMISQLRKSQLQIKKHEQELEETVASRTKELNSKIKDLTDTRTAILNILEDVSLSKDELEKSQKTLLKLNKEMESANIELKKSEDYKNQFISITAHELKTPLASIHGFAGLLQNKKILANPSQRNYYLNIIMEDSDRLKKLIDDILDLSRLDLGTMKFVFEKVNIRDVLKDVMKEMYVLASKNGLILKADAAANVPAEIITDKSRFNQVLINLVNNSVKYTPKRGGRINVHAEQKGEHVFFSIKDTGIGIARKHYKKLFQRFYQADSWLTRKVGGSGLGLSICKGIVEALGGKIGFKSKVNKGSTFFFTLPIKSKMAVAEEQNLEIIKTKTPAQDSTQASTQISAQVPTQIPAQPATSLPLLEAKNAEKNKSKNKSEKGENKKKQQKKK